MPTNTDVRANQRKVWADVILSAAATEEPFEDVRIITLREFFKQRVYDMASAGIQSQWSDNSILRSAEHIALHTPPLVSERVIFSSSGSITIVVDADTINDGTILDAFTVLNSSFGRQNINGEVITGPTVMFGLAELIR